VIFIVIAGSTLIVVVGGYRVLFLPKHDDDDDDDDDDDAGIDRIMSRILVVTLNKPDCELARIYCTFSVVAVSLKRPKQRCAFYVLFLSSFWSRMCEVYPGPGKLDKAHFSNERQPRKAAKDCQERLLIPGDSRLPKTP
jgi:hypothetical protein